MLRTFCCLAPFLGGIIKITAHGAGLPPVREGRRGLTDFLDDIPFEIQRALNTGDGGPVRTRSRSFARSHGAKRTPSASSTSPASDGSSGSSDGPRRLRSVSKNGRLVDHSYTYWKQGRPEESGSGAPMLFEEQRFANFLAPQEGSPGRKFPTLSVWVVDFLNLVGGKQSLTLGACGKRSFSHEAAGRSSSSKGTSAAGQRELCAGVEEAKCRGEFRGDAFMTAEQCQSAFSGDTPRFKSIRPQCCEWRGPEEHVQKLVSAFKDAAIEKIEAGGTHPDRVCSPREICQRLSASCRGPVGREKKFSCCE